MVFISIFNFDVSPWSAAALVLVAILGLAFRKSLVTRSEVQTPSKQPRCSSKRVDQKKQRKHSKAETDKTPQSDPYTSIRPIPDFDWKTEAPVALRPFKPQYHLTMALETITLDELVAVDKTYESRTQLRRQIMTEHPSTLDSRPGCEAAVYEFYDWMTKTYLPQRFPSMYSLRGDEEKLTAYLRNRVTGEDIPLRPASVREALYTIGAHVDTDFLILLPSGVDGKYHLEAFVACFPSGFSTLEKLGMPLAAIHKPVPGYAAKLEKSMDRFFATIPIGKIVRRANWTVTTNDVLYSEKGTHLYAEEHVDNKDSQSETNKAGSNEKTLDVKSPDIQDEIERQKLNVKVPDCRLRCERQTLHRLPATKALVFGFKTYQYELADVKSEGSGEDLASAIEGFAKGSVPEMEFYKRGVVWGEAVKNYLRS